MRREENWNEHSDNKETETGADENLIFCRKTVGIHDKLITIPNYACC